MPYPVAHITFTNIDNLVNDDPRLLTFIARSLTVNNPNADAWKENLTSLISDLYQAALGVAPGPVGLNETDEFTGNLTIQPDPGDPGSLYEVPYVVSLASSEFDNP